MTQPDPCAFCEVSEYRIRYAANNPQQRAPEGPQHFWQKPGCAASIGVTAVGALATAGEAAAIWFVGPEFLAVAGEAVGEETVESGTLGGVNAMAHIAEGIGTAVAAPVLVTAAGISGIATKCF